MSSRELHLSKLGSNCSTQAGYRLATNTWLRKHLTPKLPLEEGIHAARLLLARCWFDAERCRAGIEALQHYRRTFNERLREFKAIPVHDWSSHGADAYRGLAVRHTPPQKKRERRLPFDGRRGMPSGRPDLAWMGAWWLTVLAGAQELLC